MTEPTPPSSRWYHSVGFVLLMLFVLAGPLALPLLWKSPRFPRWAKWLLTVIMIASLWWITVKAIEIVQSSVRAFDSIEP